MNLTARILIAMVIGGLIGWGVQTLGFGPGSFIDTYLTHGLIEVGGKIFVNSLKLMVVPLVFVSLVCGASSLSGGNLGRLGGKDGEQGVGDDEHSGGRIGHPAGDVQWGRGAAAWLKL